MMRTIKVGLKNRSYKIIVGHGALARLGSLLKRSGAGKDAYIITNAYLRSRYGGALGGILGKAGFSCRFKLVPDTEKSKSLPEAARILDELSAYDRKKDIFIVAFGGGVVGDLAGFVASIYRRGIPYVQLPTSFLAQVDSSIGGKTAVDLGAGKNLAGTFYQPCLVLSDTGFLMSLDRRQMISALAEVIKYALIKDRTLFAYLEKNLEAVLAKNRDCLDFVVGRCAAIKASIVSRDEKEKLGLRTVLNFGHTIGHAIEAAGGYKRYNHGESVGLGMLAAIEISRDSGLLKEKDALRAAALIKRSGLPLKAKGITPGRVVRMHYHDKKFSGKTNKFVLLEGIGKAVVRRNIGLSVITGSLKGIF